MRCPNPLPGDLEAHVAAIADAWALCGDRPRVTSDVRKGWSRLLDDWVSDGEMPLLVRRSGAGRGQVIRHISGRRLVPADNSPAHWSLALALQSEVPTLDNIRSLFERDSIPVAMILSRKEREQATYRCTRSAVSLNELGWKVAHIDDVALGRGELETIPIASLRSHFLRFLTPSNMFVVPLEWAGLAELPRVIQSIKAVDGY